MNNTVNGSISAIFEKQTISDKFAKREFVVTTNGTYPESILIQLVNDKCSLLDLFKIGQEVNVSVNLKGRSWTNPEGVIKYFNTVEGWRIEAGAEATSEHQTAQAESDDLPF